MPRFPRTLAAAIALLAASPAAADWREATSEHFVIFADADEKWLRGYAERLERFDAATRFIRGVPDDPDARSNRLTIHVVDDTSAVEKLCGCKGVAGFYVPRAARSVAFTPRSNDGGEFGLGANTVLFHEYAHHLMLANVSLPLPRWLVEGFAEFYGSSSLGRDGSVTIGRAAMHRAYGLVLARPMAITTLLDPPQKPFNMEQADVFYGKSWVLTHMLMLDPARRGQLTRYLDLLESGKTGLEAASGAFGDLKALDRDLTRYINKQTIALTVPAARLTVKAIEVRTLRPAESAMMPVRMQSERGVNDKQAKALVAEGRRRARGGEADAAVQAQLAEVEYDAGNDAEAEAAADRALAADAKHRNAMLYKARVLMRRAAAQSGGKLWNEARGWIVRANRLDPNTAEPLMLFYESFLEQGETPTKSAVTGLARAHQLAPQDRGLRFMHARQLLIDKDAKSARRVLLPLAYDPHARGASNQALAVVELLDANKLAEALAKIGAGSAEDEPGE